METVWRPTFPVDIAATLGCLRRGRYDPTYQVQDGHLWRTTVTPAGGASYRLTQLGPREIACSAWGDGAEWVLDGLPDLLGARDAPEDFPARHPLLVRTHAAHPGLRIPRTNRVFEALAPAILEQKVTGKQARAAFRWLVLKYGDEAPGPVLGLAPGRRRPAAVSDADRREQGVLPAGGGGGDDPGAGPGPAAGCARGGGVDSCGGRRPRPRRR